jgi:hypothetical protein
MQRLNLKKSKKAEVTDIIVLLLILFFLGISFIVVVFVNEKLKQVVSTTPLNQTSTGQTVIRAYTTIDFTTVPNAYIFIFAFLIIGQIVTSFLVRYHPVFIVLFLIFAGFGVFLAIVLANVYSLFVNSGQINDIAVQMPLINWVWQHITLIMSAVSALTLVVLFARLPSSGGQI